MLSKTNNKCLKPLHHNTHGPNSMWGFPLKSAGAQQRAHTCPRVRWCHMTPTSTCSAASHWTITLLVPGSPEVWTLELVSSLQLILELVPVCLVDPFHSIHLSLKPTERSCNQSHWFRICSCGLILLVNPVFIGCLIWTSCSPAWHQSADRPPPTLIRDTTWPHSFCWVQCDEVEKLKKHFWPLHKFSFQKC